MKSSNKCIGLIVLLVAAMLASGCGISKKGMLAYNEARELFNKATLMNAKKCAPVEYAKAEAYLAHADQEVAEGDEWRENHFWDSVTKSKEYSLEAMRICEKPPAPPAPKVEEKPAPPPKAEVKPELPSAPPPAAPPALKPKVEPPSPPPKAEIAAPPPPPPPRAEVKPVPPPPPPPAAPPAPKPGVEAAPPPPRAEVKPVPPPPPKPPAPKPPAVEKEPVFEMVFFDINKTNINPAAASALDRNAKILVENPGLKVEIIGHADSTGSEKANRKISEKRAESAKRYLVDKFNVSSDRLKTKGEGSSKPIADNATSDGRAKNRRVEFRVLK